MLIIEITKIFPQKRKKKKMKNQKYQILVRLQVKHLGIIIYKIIYILNVSFKKEKYINFFFFFFKNML